MARGRDRGDEPTGGESDAGRGQLSFGLGPVGVPPPPRPTPPPAAPAQPPTSVAPAPPVTAGAVAAAVAPPKPTEPRVFTVIELVRSVRVTLEARYADVRVEGEISGCKRTGPGHLYFSLKDSEAQIECVMFSREASRLKLKVADGMLVRCRGRLTLYEGRGRFQMTVVALEPAGAGVLALAFEELKRKLAAEGLFAPERKRKLPFLPRRIGVVTSASGAVILDIIRVAHRRFPVRLLLAPTPVQGEGAALSIIAALRGITRVKDVDLVILARGGGSLEDLWCFNDEGLARAIAACPVPIISAVGHETDFTIADFVADVRAPTPSAAAELAVPMLTDLTAELAVLQRRVARAMTAELSTRRLVIERARRRLGDPRRLVDAQRQALDDLGARATTAARASISRRAKLLAGVEARLLRAHPQRRIAVQRAELTALLRRLEAAAGARFASRHRALDGLRAKLESLSPLSVLERGYALARRADGHVATSAAALTPGEALAVRFADGEVDTRVEAVRTSAPETTGSDPAESGKPQP